MQEIRPGRPSRAGVRVALGSLLVLVALSVVFHEDVLSRLSPPEPPDAPSRGVPHPRSESERELIQFDEYVFDHLERTFERELTERGLPHASAKLVHFAGRVRSPCGRPDSVSGTFYCPSERRAYVDLELYRQLRLRYGGKGDFAEAYVLAHAMGHHLQNLQGIEARTRRQIARRPTRAADLRTRYELQADCYAAVWARIATERELLHPGDLEEGMEAAARLGAELSERVEDAAVLETYTHATARRRAEWFERGFENGRIEACDVFARDAL